MSEFMCDGKKLPCGNIIYIYIYNLFCFIKKARNAIISFRHFYLLYFNAFTLGNFGHINNGFVNIISVKNIPGLIFDFIMIYVHSGDRILI